MHKLNKYTISACLGLLLGTGQAFAGAKPDENHSIRSFWLMDYSILCSLLSICFVATDI